MCQWDHLLFRSHCPSQPSYYFCSYKTFLSQSTWQKDKIWNRTSSRAWPPHKVRTIYPVTQRVGDESRRAEGLFFLQGDLEQLSDDCSLPPWLGTSQIQSDQKRVFFPKSKGGKSSTLSLMDITGPKCLLWSIVVWCYTLKIPQTLTNTPKSYIAQCLLNEGIC